MTKKSDAPKKIDIEDKNPTAGDTVAGIGEAFKKIHEQGKADRKVMRDVAKDLGEDVMENAKDFTEKAADAASKATAAATEAGAKVAASVSPEAGKAAEAAGKVANDAAEAAAKVAGQAAKATADVASKAAAAASDVAEKAEAVAEKSADQLVEEAKKQADEWQDKYMRLHAEWDTYRRRTAEQRDEERSRATEGLVGDLLPVLDDFERSIEYAVKNGSENLLDGVQAVHNKMVDTLKKSGVEVIDPAGEAFDALEAQAVAKVTDENVPDETVNEVYQKGYKMGKKVIRPATVTVTEGGPKREKPEEEK